MHSSHTFPGARLCLPAAAILFLISAGIRISAQSSTSPWPGADDARTVDPAAAFDENLSGLAFERTADGAPVLWAVQNRPGKLFLLKQNGSGWMPDTENGWKGGRQLRYPNGKGSPDAEGITFAGAGPAAGIYVGTERDNDANSRSRNSVLLFNATQSGTSLTATMEWNLTADLPRTGANEGIEAIAWIPDPYLVQRGFHDEATGRAYDPAEYPDHGSGLFVVGVEGTGQLYVYALNHANGSFKRVATMKSGLAHVMVLEFDLELNHLWAVCDDGCGTRAAILQVAPAGGPSNAGRFAVTRIVERPRSLPNVNNEGFAVATQSECRNGHKPAFWADDSDTGGHSIRSASVTCSPFSGAPGGAPVR